MAHPLSDTLLSFEHAPGQRGKFYSFQVRGEALEVARGQRGIRMAFRIKADAPEEKLEEIVRLGPTFSPVFDTVTRHVTVEVSLKK
jgi:uncharacterized OsmC-like protein